jgi:hypothetical protein
LLDPKEAPAKALLALSDERWESALAIEAEQRPWPQAPQPLRSRARRTLLQECCGLLLLPPAVGFLMQQAAVQEDLDPDRRRCCHALEVVQQAGYEFALLAPQEYPALMEPLVADRGSCLLPARWVRFHPRGVKRPLSRFRRKRDWHLDGPHLKGSCFADLLLLL